MLLSRLINLMNMSHIMILNASTVFEKVTLKISQTRILLLRKLKTLYFGHMLLVILTVKTFLERFFKKNGKKQTKQALELEK